jgi:hypothetical protein
MASYSDASIIAEARGVYNSPLFERLRNAYEARRPDTVQIGRWSIQYESIAFSGMTAFPDGFVIGNEAFASEDELKKTLLHELYRLCTSSIGRGASATPSNIKAETDAAFWFAENNYVLV